MVQFENISQTQKATKTVSEIELPAAKSFDDVDLLSTSKMKSKIA